MDDVNIHIDELVLDGAGATDNAALTAALLERAGPSIDPRVVSAVGLGLARAVNAVTVGGGRDRP